VSARPITFLSDYGYEDEFAGVCRGVIAGIAPEASVTDLTHGIDPGDVRGGALALRRALPFCPAGVHLAVVDPGVGGDRRAVAVRTGDGERLLVGPDNGLLAPAAEALGGAAEAFDVGASPARLQPVSATFHGRDVFAPVAARLALGEAPEEHGERIDPAVLTGLELPVAEIASGRIAAQVLGSDRFGNVALNVAAAELPGSLAPGQRLKLELPATGTVEVPFARSFGEVAAGEPLVYEDSGGNLAIAVNRASAEQLLMLAVDDEVVLRPG
jgi:S-adenosylmethionine hydrolase